MKILFVAAEGGPFYKTGGLGDVIQSLPKELKKEGIDVRVMLPYYSSMPEHYKKNIKDIGSFSVKMGSSVAYAGLKQLELDDITYYFIDNESYFYRDNLYGYWDDGERFAFFSMACIESLEKINFIPDIIHVHDWHAAMIPVLLVHKYNWIEAYKNIRKVLTIHNIQFQGIYDPIMLNSIFEIGYDAYNDNGLKHFDQINYLKGGIHYSDVVTTVSPSYAKEIQTLQFGERLDGDLKHNTWKVIGILNGISYDVNNPRKDTLIDYKLKTSIPRFKQENKRLLQEKLNLKVDKEVALVGMVSRLTDQKGLDLITEGIDELMHRNMQLVILGTGDSKYENSLLNIQNKYGDRVSINIEFDLNTAQNIYAASDIFLMPSKFEPCGLSQMISFCYGTIPLVHETGGLKDTVIPFNTFTKEGTGFSFSEYNVEAMLEVLDIALTCYYDEPQIWDKLIKQAMELDFSWHRSVIEYKKMYDELLVNI